MSVSQIELGRRLRQAREASGLTQEVVADHLDVSRPTVAQIELGKRAVSSLELNALAKFYGRDIRDFLADEVTEEDLIPVLFRSQPDAAVGEIQSALRECIAMGYDLTALEEKLGINRGLSTVATYSISAPKTKWEAIQSGTIVAKEERRRLGLGFAPLRNIPQLFESQGVRSGLIPMVDQISGLTLRHPRAGLFIVINEKHSPFRRRFSWCHEYAHVLFDRDGVGMVSHADDRASLIEVRANSFAANFLMPEEGVKLFLAGLGKASAVRSQTEVYEEEGDALDVRAKSDLREFQLVDIVQLAYFFGVSVLSAVYRLRNLRLISEGDFSVLKSSEEQGKSTIIAKILGIRWVDESESETTSVRRFLSLSLEAYRRGHLDFAEFVSSTSRWLTKFSDIQEADVAEQLRNVAQYI